MKKLITVSNTNIEVRESNIMTITIGDITFEKDEFSPWVDVYLIGKEYKEPITQIDNDSVCSIIDSESMKIFCLNWFFNNVRIAKEEPKIKIIKGQISVEEVI